MDKKIISSAADLESYVGTEIGVSEYHQITQDQINKFADATLDHQWIHVDIDRAKEESPFKNTIAHGYLSISLLPYLWNQIVDVRNLKMMVNYGMENLRFNQPVIVDSNVRLRVQVESLQDLRGTIKVKMNAKLEIEGNKKPAYEAVIVFLYQFEN